MTFQRQILSTIVLLWTPAAHPQTPTQTQIQTTELVREAVASLSEQAQATHRFTFFELAHTQNRNEKGKLYFDRTTLTETTYIADLPFDRLIQVDGKPLTGKALAEEQFRYDQAVRDRAALDAAARSRLDHLRFLNAALPYSQLTTRFALSEVRVEAPQIEDTTAQPVHVVDATPIPSSNPALPTESRHIRLWISPSTPGLAPHLLRADFDYLTPDRTTDSSSASEIEPGSHGSVSFTFIDGIALPVHKEVHSRIVPAPNSKPIQVDVDRTYSQYRQFTSSTRIVPVNSPAPQ